MKKKELRLLKRLFAKKRWQKQLASVPRIYVVKASKRKKIESYVIRLLHYTKHILPTVTYESVLL